MLPFISDLVGTVTHGAMVSKIHILLAATNLVGILPFLKADGIFEKSLVFCMILSSIAMHITETKHRLFPSNILSLSAICLNLDRGSAMISTLYFFPKWWKNTDPGITALFMWGIVASGIGELTDNVVLYCILHSFWHVSVYVTMSRLL